MTIDQRMKGLPTLPMLYTWWDLLLTPMVLFVAIIFTINAPPVLRDISISALLVTLFGILFVRALLSRNRKEGAKSILIAVCSATAMIMLMSGLTENSSPKANLRVVIELSLYLIGTGVIFIELSLALRQPKPDPKDMPPLWIRIIGAAAIIGVGIPVIFYSSEISGFILSFW